MRLCRRPSLLAALALACAIAGIVPGCASKGSGPHTERSGTVRDTQRAVALNQAATRAMPSDPAEAERLLREALGADLYCGPAHNNLGTILLRRGALYEAAGEFEWARKLMPGHPDPRVNLAMTLERAGKVDDALAAYDSALAVYDGYLPAVQGKARLQIATGRTDGSTLALLEEVAFRGDEGWREWAASARTRMESARSLHE